MSNTKELIDKVDQAKQVGWSKIVVDGVQLVIVTQEELDAIIKQSRGLK